MNKVLICIILIFFSGCSNTNKVNENKPISLEVKELEFGICETKTVVNEQMENSPSGTYTLSRGFKIVDKTDSITAKLGQKFGVKFIMQSDVNKNLSIEQVWIFPETITNDKGEKFKELRYTVNKPTNEKTYSTYTLEKNFEVVKGEWIYQMFYNDSKIYEKTFYLIEN